MSLHQAPFDLIRLPRATEADFSHAAQRKGLIFRREVGVIHQRKDEETQRRLQAFRLARLVLTHNPAIRGPTQG